ncbi:MAG: tRNA (N6-threonylcarbamoyladenosine(37)-N6)-methyltransferase TrmO [Oscillospiraceae bacterium]|nr:tRNA (N6-threonylcarbamoyladenosine(37)-N6)-methyltransferase TrmO [Oscillospiraceae bacterium]
MVRKMEIEPIAFVRNDFKEKFGIPRQAGLADKVESRVEFTGRYRNPDAIRGVEGFSRLWLIWGFSEARLAEWSPTVRPPRLGGNERIGVFATRSPYRPNSLALSSVKLLRVEGGDLIVAGADVLDGTPVYDIKPYLPYADAFPDERAGWTEGARELSLSVEIPAALAERIAPGKREALLSVLRNDPRPSYQRDSERVYGLRFGDYNVKFTVSGDTLTVKNIEEAQK